MALYLACHNSDLTEGRGGQVGFALFDNEEAAVKAVKGYGVMGVGDGEVYRLGDPEKVFSTVEEWKDAGSPKPGVNPQHGRDTHVYGYRKGWNGKWGYGWVDNRDAPMNDPEYAEFQRLRAKFVDRTLGPW